MKFVLFFLAVAIIGTDSAPPSDYQDYQVKQKIDAVLDDSNLQKLADRSIVKFISIVSKSLDKSCMVNYYKKYNLVEKIPIANSPPREDDVVNYFIFLETAALCSTKTNAILEFSFENLMSYHTLLKAFINDPELVDLSDFLHCANKYAVTNGITIPHQYELNFTLKKETEEECNAMTRKLDVNFAMLKRDFQKQINRPCVDFVINEMKKIMTRNILLVQVDLDEIQKRQEENNFVRDIRMVLEDSLKCAGGN